MWLFSESTETGLSSGTGPVFIAPCVLALQVLESGHLEKLRSQFTAFSHNDGSMSNSLELCRLLTTKNTHISKDKLFALTFFGTVGAQVCFSKPSGMAILLHGNLVMSHCPTVRLVCACVYTEEWYVL